MNRTICRALFMRPSTLYRSAEHINAITTNTTRCLSTTFICHQENQQSNNAGLLATIRNDMKQAMRAKDKPRVAVLKSVITEVTYAEKNATNDETATAALSDTGVIITLQRSIKKRQESIDAYKSANRDDLALKEQEEITMLVGYLPAQLTPQEIETEVKRAVDEVDATTVKDMGRVMRAIRIEPGRASKQAIADTIKSVFSNKKSA